MARVLRASGVRALEAIGDLDRARSARPSDGPTVLAPLLAELRARRRRVFGDVMDMTLDGLCRIRATP